MRRWVTCVLLLTGVVLAAGCSREGEKDKNKDLDRPKPAEAGKEK
ncbi:MAG TPA: hypothetical protein VGF55_25070 [Gemmataceae bacterium]|jgi:hypothetical protein